MFNQYPKPNKTDKKNIQYKSVLVNTYIIKKLLDLFQNK